MPTTFQATAELLKILGQCRQAECVGWMIVLVRLPQAPNVRGERLLACPYRLVPGKTENARSPGPGETSSLIYSPQVRMILPNEIFEP